MTNEELVATLNQRFDQLEQRMDERLNGLDESVHQTHILVENFDVKIGAMHDGIKIVDEKLDRFRKETTKNLTELSTRVLVLETKVR